MTSGKSNNQAELDARKKRIYSVQVRRASTGEMALRMIVYFGILLLAVGLSRVWFGGSWIIDLICFLAALSASIVVARHRVSDSVRMTPAQLREWLDAGCPDSWPEGFDLRD